MTTKAFELAQLGDAVTVSSNGEVGIGTSSPDKKLDVDTTMRVRNAAGSSAAELDVTSGSTWRVRSNPTSGTNSYGLDFIKGSGGTDVKMALDSSGNLGVGTSGPQQKLHVNGGAADTTIQITNSASGSAATDGFSLSVENPSADVNIRNRESSNMRFYTGNNERMRITSNGKVGISEADPIEKLHVDGQLISTSSNSTSNTSGSERAVMDLTSHAARMGHFRGSTSAGSGKAEFYTDSVKRMTIDASGNLLVGKSSSTGETAGCELREGGRGIFTKSGSNPLQVRRLSDNGKIVVFYKDTTQVGSIGIHSTGFFIDGESGHTGLRFGANTFIPRDNQADADNVVDLGAASARFDDVHATNGTIQTSDRNEKQDIAELTDAEITAAKAISKLFKTFKWKDKVASKGDAARTHTGVIAQEVETAMSDAGLDAGNYAFFISNTWWETSTEVPSVEADEESDIEAQEAHTRIDTYNTSDEAPEGATQRNRKGIRYPELLSFIGAATEQRLTNIETRLDALEAGELTIQEADERIAE